MKQYPATWFFNTNAPQRHRKFHHTENTDTLWGENFNKVKSLCDIGGLIGLIGVRGCGKTQTAVSMIAMYKSQNKKALYTKLLDMTDSIIENGRCSSEQKFLKPDLLIIDAVQNRRDTPAEDRIIQSILDKRYDLERTTILCSNDAPETLLSFIGNDGFSRMEESGGVVVYSNNSFRKKGI